MKLTAVKDLIPAPKDGTTGQPGQSAVWQYLTVDTCEVYCDAQGVPKNPSLQLFVRKWVRVGNAAPIPLTTGQIVLQGVRDTGAKVTSSRVVSAPGYVMFTPTSFPAGIKSVEASLVVNNVEVHRVAITYRWDAEEARSVADLKMQYCACRFSVFSEADMAPEGWRLNAAEAPLSPSYSYRFERLLTFFSDDPQTPHFGSPVLTGSLGVDGVGAYMLNLSNDMAVVGLVQRDGDYYPGEDMCEVSTGLDMAGAPNAHIVHLSLTREEGCMISCFPSDLESTIEDPEEGVLQVAISANGIRLEFNPQTPFAANTRRDYEIRADIEVTEGGETRNITLVRVWSLYFQPPGADGLSPVVYELKPDQDYFMVNPNAQMSLGAIASCKVVRRFGTGYKVLTVNEIVEAGLTVFLYDGHREMAGVSFPIYPSEVSVVQWILRNADNVVIDSEYVPIVTNGRNGLPGDDGAPGEKGAAIRGPMEWTRIEEGFLFQNGGNGCSFHDIVFHAGQFYNCILSHQKSSTPPNQDELHWEVGADFEFIATKLFLAQKGKIENLQVDDIKIFYDGTNNALFVADKSGLRFCNRAGQQTIGLDADGNIEGQNCRFVNVYANGVFESYDAVNGNRIIVDAASGSIEMKGPDGLREEDGLPREDAEETTLLSMSFDADENNSRVATLTLLHPTSGAEIRMDPSEGIYIRGDFGLSSGRLTSEGWEQYS